MSARTHFCVSPEPVDFSLDLPREALCGTLLARPRPEIIWNLTTRGLPEFNSLRDCVRCIKRAELWGHDPNTGEFITQDQKYYLYGIVEGEEQQGVSGG